MPTPVRLVWLMAAFLAMAALSACGDGVSEDSTASGASNREVEHRAPIAAAEIAARDLSRQFSSSATVEAYGRTRLASRTPGIIAEVGVEAGDIVEEGEILARLDMSEQMAELRRAQTELQQAQRNYERGTTLHERGHLTSMEYDRLRVEMQLAERESELWQTRGGFGEIRAPMNAGVTARHIEPGEGVQVQDVLFNLTSIKLLVLRVGVSERDVVRNAVDGAVPTRFMSGTQEYDLRVRLPREETRDSVGLGDLVFFRGEGTPVQLRDVASIDLGAGPAHIARENQSRIVRVNAAINTSVADVGTVMDEVEARLAGLDIPERINLVFEGQWQTIQETDRELVLTRFRGGLSGYIQLRFLLPFCQ